MSGPVVTIVKVKAPWYAFPFLLRRGFRKTVPEYRALPGLQSKYFVTTAQDKFFGGIYLWADQAAAQQQFSPAWFDRVRRTYSTEGEVAYYPLLDAKHFVALTHDYQARERGGTTVFLHATDAATTRQLSTQPAAGLLRLYAVREPAEQQGLILLFANLAMAKDYLKTAPTGTPELFDTPVLLDNEPLTTPK